MLDNPFLKEMVGMLKANAENSFQTISLLQEQSEKVARLMIEQGTAVQAEGRKFLEQWMDALKKQQQDYREKLKSQMEKLEQFLGKTAK